MVAVYLWVATRRGWFGEIDRVLSLREMRAIDRAGFDLPDPSGLADGVRARLVDPGFGMVVEGVAERHFPGVSIVLPVGRVAFELFADPPTAGYADALLAAYAAKPQVTSLVVCVASSEVAESVSAAVERQGLDFVRVQRYRFTGGAM